MKYKKFSVSALLQTLMIKGSLLRSYAKRYCKCSFVSAIIGLNPNLYINSEHSLNYWGLIPCRESQQVFNSITIQDLVRTYHQDSTQFSSYSGSVVNLQHINDATQNLNRLSELYRFGAERIEGTWSHLSDQERQELKEFVYFLIEENDSNKKIPLHLVIFDFFRSRFYGLRTLIFYVNQLKQLNRQLSLYKEAKQRCAESQYQFIDAVLNEIEKDDPCYQQVLSDTLDELTCKGSELNSVGVPIPEDTREWLRSLSDNTPG